MGPAVWNGGFSTYIAVGPLVLSNSYPTMTFFKVRYHGNNFQVEHFSTESSNQNLKNIKSS